MVCLVGPVLKKEQFEEHQMENIHDMNTEDVVHDENFDDEYNLVKVAGGSLVEHPPLFSPNGKYIYIISREKVLVYSTTTGEWVRNFEEFGKSNIVGLQFSLNDPKTIIGCTMKGEFIFWDYKTGSISSRSKIPITTAAVQTFTLLNLAFGPSALITYKDENKNMKYTIINIAKNTIVDCPIDLELKNDSKVITLAENNHFNYFVIAQNFSFLVVDQRRWYCRMWKNAFKVNITAIKVHPTEMMVATGDEHGKIFLYRNLFKRGIEPESCLYHWHHTRITSLEFTLSGSGFYSGGLESVLVKWNINRPQMKDFVPRLSGYIQHIVVGDQNKKIAVCTADNGIHIFDDQNRQKCILQNFTFVFDNKCNQERFPVGLKLNPVNNTLVLNGRYGHLQFYSTYTKSLLYNVDIVMQNKLSMESKKILYDIMISSADFNVNWMVTVEYWNDQEHLPELRLKFWKFIKETQSYSLSTCIELPHEDGIKTVKFSSSTQTENLLCATLGHDNYIKIWCLEDSGSIYKKKGKNFWVCIARAKYKDYQATSLDFSADGSLLAVGYGNTLCIFKSNSLKLKSVLTAPPLYDGTLQKVQICYNDKKLTSIIKGNDNCQKLLELFKNFEENIGDKGIIKLLENSSLKIKKPVIPSSFLVQTKNNEILFKKIMRTTELNLFQKLLLYQKLNMNFSIPPNVYSKMITYLNYKVNRDENEKKLRKVSNIICPKNMFKAKYRLRKYYSRKNVYESKVNEILVPILNLLKIEERDTDIEMKLAKSNGFGNGIANDCEEEIKRRKVNEIKNIEEIPFNLQNIAHVKNVCFGKADFAHLIIITTENRIIIWNILTLRIQFVLKLSVKRMVVDELTSLCAALTQNNELYVFLPNAPLYLYRRSNMPDILNICWVPRKYPRSKSLTLDWQAVSTLYFLTEDQELIMLSSTQDDDVKESLAFVNEPSEVIRHSIYDVHSLKKMDRKGDNSRLTNVDTIGVPGKAEITSIIQMASHTSAPMNLLCNNFIKSLLSASDVKTASTNQVNSNRKEHAESESDDENDEVYLKIKQKQKIFDESVKTSNKILKVKDEKALKKVLNEKLPDTIQF